MKNFIRKLISRRKLTKGQQNGNTSGNTPTPAIITQPPPPAMENRGQEQQVLTAAAGSLTVALQNKSNSNQVYAYITGLSMNDNFKPIFIQSDGRSVYSPPSPSKTGAALTADVAIRLGPPGNTVNVTIPKIAGGRIWFSIGAPLTFLVNPGPAIVEPSVTNPSDPNYNVFWSFCEFTYNDQQLFANISYVDFVSIPIAMSLTNTAGHTQTVPGMPENGFNTVVNLLRQQAAADGQPWDQLVYSHNGQALRALSPNNLRVGNQQAFSSYWNSYIQRVWAKYQNEDLTINTQAAAGDITGRIRNNELQLSQAGSFAAPTSADIWTCNSGPFTTGSNAARNAAIPRLAAAFNRSTLLDSSEAPNGSHPGSYYRDGITNHYSRILHQVSKDGRGYGFPYDDVVPDGGQDVAGTVFDGSPRVFTVAVGGG
ncbi:hypothetical protein GQ43DRAFT_444428 [Delitschia confertaspora ATCC 74209]|uniref:GH64 domain-containing protein n=1 Tax=Delitschia confertaspora ATCC 74209 TaxID=1513339 RepID=A0A9P4JFZ2_9PLEO|nr:hypothetical protein GQ43DRAFT_444428 [Delitschia confertaspora ATCC 74209]